MKKVKFLTYTVFVLILGFVISSCEGPAGPAGADGTDGVDGNANVTSIYLSATDITWTAGTYIGLISNVFVFTDTSVSQDIIDRGAVLGFAYMSGGGHNAWFPLPFAIDSGSNHWTITYTYALNTIALYAYTESAAWDPNSAFVEYHFLLITDNTVGGKSVTNTSVLEELKNAGVDANDYFDVCDYYDINPK